jgi:hypothetical protein
MQLLYHINISGFLHVLWSAESATVATIRLPQISAPTPLYTGQGNIQYSGWSTMRLHRFSLVREKGISLREWAGENWKTASQQQLSSSKKVNWQSFTVS